MNGLALVNDQLEVIAGYTDWGGHGELMDKVDAEIEDINFVIKSFIEVRDSLGEVDERVYLRVTAGLIPPNQASAELAEKMVEVFRSIATTILRQSAPLVRKGFRIEHLSRVREIAENPGAGLHLPQIAAMAREMTLPDGTIREVDLSDDLAKIKAAIQGRN